MYIFSRFKNRLIAAVITRFPSLADRIIDKIEPLAFDSTPWTPVTKPLSRSTVALVTTAGVHLSTDTPFDMSDSTGDPSFRVIPSTSATGELTITHDYYDHSDADRDVNIVFPIDRLREMAGEERIGKLAARFYGFMGHIEENHIERFVGESLPSIARMMKDDGVDVALIVPG